MKHSIFTVTSEVNPYSEVSHHQSENIFQFISVIFRFFYVCTGNCCSYFLKIITNYVKFWNVIINWADGLFSHYYTPNEIGMHNVFALFIFCLWVFSKVYLSVVFVCLYVLYHLFFFYWMCDLAIHGAQIPGSWRWYRHGVLPPHQPWACTCLVPVLRGGKR